MPNGKHIEVRFVPSGRGKAQCPSDPRFPDGMNFDASTPGLPSCFVELPYPAPECGMHVIHCHLCEHNVGITAAGRPDDPRTVRLPCNPDGKADTGPGHRAN